LGKKKSKPELKAKDVRFEPVNTATLYPVLDAISWLDLPNIKQISQFAGVDPRTAGKLIKNCQLIGLVHSVGENSFKMSLAYPLKGTEEQKKAIVKEAVLRMPLIINLRQFIALGDNTEVALRKSATVIGVESFEPVAFTPLLKLANGLGLLSDAVTVEDLVDKAVADKENRHRAADKKIVAFLSHSSKDKAFVRQLAADLEKEGIGIWLDEQNILVGDSISEKIGQGLAESDYFLIALSNNSAESAWVKKELSRALLAEVEKRQVVILPVKISDCEIPELIKDKKYADFSQSYKLGLQELIVAMRKGR
jgi:hypothetical protein